MHPCVLAFTVLGVGLALLGIDIAQLHREQPAVNYRQPTYRHAECTRVLFSLEGRWSPNIYTRCNRVTPCLLYTSDAADE